MQQIIHIHGGEVFPDETAFLAYLQQNEYNPFEALEKKRRRNWLREQLATTHQVFLPDMPNSWNASYKARKIWFEKLFPYLNDEGIILSGNSLWTIFLLKYLTENAFLKKITQLHLVGIVLDEQGLSEDDHYLGDFLFDIEKIPTITKQVQKVFIYHSKDDETCPYTHAERLAKLLPNAEFLTFEERGHFMQAEFPELLENILK